MGDQSMGNRTKHRLDISRDNEMLQRFVRINLDENDNTDECDEEIHTKIDVTKEDGGTSQLIEYAVTEEWQRSILSSLDQSDSKTSKNDRKNRKKTRQMLEELYTDKDRAAAVNMGTWDIKYSLNLKRKQDRSKVLSIPEEADPGSFLALGNYQMIRGDSHIALDFINKALELNPSEKNALVARSKCYILLGQPENGLKDAESALAIDKNFMKAIYQKAESLYYLGDFEHSLMYYHRGLRLRPDHEGFKLGVHKAQKAIENAIGGAFPCITTPSRASNATTKSSTKQKGRVTNKTDATNSPEKVDNKKDKKQKTMIKGKQPKRNCLLRELGTDKEYLDNLLINPNLQCKFKEDNTEIVDCIKGAIDFLNKRQEFWRQQLPPRLNK